MRRDIKLISRDDPCFDETRNTINKLQNDKNELYKDLTEVKSDLAELKDVSKSSN